ncbi:DedA family protein [Candidatus Gottesmanbacteria bacterium]|nr:DedA family protein [Candidatus Gottesmanbacteria bacterium]
MELFKAALDLFLHLDTHLANIVTQYGIFAYGLLFLIIFLETGFVVTPFLPGDSLLFVAGTLSGAGILHIQTLLIFLILAAILGDTVNYWIGHFFGPKVFNKKNSKIFKPEYLEKTRKFYSKHGGKTIILARFIPIIRTFAPFVAGVGRMHYGQFLSYNLIGAVAWVLLFTLGGYLFGNISFVRENFHYTVIIIVALSLVPVGAEYVKHLKEKKAATAESVDFESIEKTFHKKHLSD